MQTSSSLSSSSSDSKPQMKEHCDHQVDCLKMIQLILDGEATDQQLARLKANLVSCQPCIQMYHLEQEVKELLTKRMEKKCCPEQLVATIKSKILTFS
ncbi:anti-sigma factor, TIGR02949 family [Spirosoma fluviale]|jgi:anti-sigma factor (TIGR02949 family)|uniref:Anti-sigma factor, TIGR02949 family n=2 Tax=Cytophagaceae TaxID=89373 RepID=A0A286GJT5_9BACT|nr:anti-sigma factor, TIGR02949 family [Spirosoma fluviale]